PFRLCLLGGGVRLPPRQSDRDDRGVARAARGPALLCAGEGRARGAAAGRGGPVRRARPVPAASAYRLGSPRRGREEPAARPARAARPRPGQGSRPASAPGHLIQLIADRRIAVGPPSVCADTRRSTTTRVGYPPS